MDALRSLSSPTATVVRDGTLAAIPSAHVVPGDVVHLKTGDVVPADCRLFDAMNFETDEALLTGGSLPAAKDARAVLADEILGIGDRVNMAYASSTVTKGRARGIVVYTGMVTKIGKIAEGLKRPGCHLPVQSTTHMHGALRRVKIVAWHARAALLPRPHGRHTAPDETCDAPICATDARGRACADYIRGERVQRSA